MYYYLSLISILLAITSNSYDIVVLTNLIAGIQEHGDIVTTKTDASRNMSSQMVKQVVKKAKSSARLYKPLYLEVKPERWGTPKIMVIMPHCVGQHSFHFTHLNKSMQHTNSKQVLCAHNHKKEQQVKVELGSRSIVLITDSLVSMLPHSQVSAMLLLAAS